MFKKMLIVTGGIIGGMLMLKSSIDDGSLLRYFDTHPNASYVPRVEYTLGHGYLLFNSLPQAATCFVRIGDHYPKSSLADPAYFYYVFSLEQAGVHRSRLVELYEQYLVQFPDGEFRSAVDSRVSRLRASQLRSLTMVKGILSLGAFIVGLMIFLAIVSETNVILKFCDRSPTNSVVPSIEYHVGRWYFLFGFYSDAATYFLRVHERYPESSHADYCYFYYVLSTENESKLSKDDLYHLYGDYIDKYPEGRFLRLARYRMDKVMAGN